MTLYEIAWIGLCLLIFMCVMPIPKEYDILYRIFKGREDNREDREMAINEFLKSLDNISMKAKAKDSAPEFYDVLQDMKQGKNPTEDLLDKTTQKNIFIILSDEGEVPEEIIEKKLKQILEHDPTIHTLNNPERPNDKWFVIIP